MKTTYIECRPGNGGKDAELFCKENAHAILKHVQKTHPTAHMESHSQLEKGYTIIVPAPSHDYQWLRGTHTVQRMPPGSKKRHTSTMTVSVLDRKPTKTVDFRESDLRIDRYRGTGAGGQRKNKVETAIRIVHKPTGLVVTRETGRSQKENIESAKDQLLKMLLQRSQTEEHETLNASREIPAERAFTHNEQRGIVVHSNTGKSWSIKNWQKGNIS